jgi:hypothetical protein
MSSRFILTPQAIDDLHAAWWTIAEGNWDLAPHCSRCWVRQEGTIRANFVSRVLRFEGHLRLVTNFHPTRCQSGVVFHVTGIHRNSV